jgi:hypothetical protein
MKDARTSRRSECIEIGPRRVHPPRRSAVVTGPAGLQRAAAPALLERFGPSLPLAAFPMVNFDRAVVRLPPAFPWPRTARKAFGAGLLRSGGLVKLAATR